jgi:pyruvate/2-oxoglutarate dehydrogenase complex dihydrolipoamide acyltransferase (E2) component
VKKTDARSMKGFHIEQFPFTRLASIDFCDIGLRKHHVKALLEVDVTEGRRKMRRLRADAGTVVSFTGWITACVAAAGAEYGNSYAMYVGAKKIAVFDDVDVALSVERVVAGKRVPLPMRVRNAARKSAQEISAEIDAAQRESLSGGQIELGEKRPKLLERLYFSLPGFLRRPLLRLVLRSPSRVRAMMGTITITSLAMYGKSRGWAIPLSVAPLCIALGSVTRQPAVVGQEIRIRELLCLTVLLDHDVIDGAPAARFVSRLAQLIETGHGL